MHDQDHNMRVAVIVASMKRAEEIGQLLVALARQTLQPVAIVLSVVESADLPASLPDGVEVISGSPGSSVQRNRGLDLVQDRCDAVVFYDDDFLPACNALQGIVDLFAGYPEIGGATGHVLLDGAQGDAISYEQALQAVDHYERAPRPPIVNEKYLFAYGCNMAFRCTAIGKNRFDENLPLYGWQEDMDFAARVSKWGPVIRSSAFAGVHRGVKKGRSSGRAFGFSQVVNPIYLVRKGTMTQKKAFKMMSRNIVANHVKMLRPEPYVDRRGRVLGNWIGLLHLLTGRADPTLVLKLKVRNEIPAKHLSVSKTL